MTTTLAVITAPRPGQKGPGIADYLRAAIRNGRFAPGQRLIEADLTSELDVSRGPVREAFRRLAAEGLIELVPNRGAVVRRLSMTEALELFEVRTELEALAARRSAGNMKDPHTRARFEREIAQIWDDRPRLSTSGYIAENRRFHSAIMTAAGNGQLIKIDELMQLSLIMAQISSSLTSDVVAASLAEHGTIARAILDSDADRAETAIRDHLSRAADFMKSMPENVFRHER
ncbi:MAG TPA: GntR family transcriptional regulator [Afifellaceae bacterium]|nr:GntR family transcriptional regulator [Afifellaceae bacterium]